MRFELKLFHKGLVLVAVPLIFQLLFVAILSKLLFDAESVAAREARAKAIVYKAERLDQLVYQATATLVQYGATADPSLGNKFSLIEAQIPKEKEELVRAVADDPVHRPIVVMVVPLIDRALVLMKEAKRTLDESEGKMTIEYMQELRGEIQSVLAGLYPKLNEVAEAERQIVQSTPEQMLKFNRTIHNFIFAAVLLNVAIALALAFYFHLGTVRRLAVMVENARRIVVKEQLQDKLIGTDEIAHVDHVFHDMAAALAEAARKEQEALEIIKSSEARIRSVVNNMPVGLVVTNERGMIEFLNARLERLLGFKQAEVAGKHLTTFFPINTQKNPDAFVNSLRQSAAGRLVELEVGNSSGSIVPIEISLSELPMNNENYLLVSFTDISERRQIEQMKRDLIAMVSHDLRTPLMSMLISLAMITEGRAGPISEHAKNLLQSCEAGVERLIALVKSLLDAEKIKSGQLNLDRRRLPLSVILESSVDAVLSFASQNQVKIELQAKDIEITADGERLVQVVINLLSNAVKFSPKGGSVKIVSEETAQHVEVKVIDQGRGVPASYKEIIFERFQQVASTDATEKGGTGLGLPICKAIIEQHGGTIGVESEEGMGSTFWFRLPKVS
jgi:PAS domain S-box-containing protein